MTALHNPYFFQTVKDRVDIVAAAEHYGLTLDRRGWCSCPFHNEKTASFHLHNQRYRCFGCDARGDVLDLVGALLNVGPLEAVKALNGAFGLGIDLDAPVDVLAVARANAARQERERFKRWRSDAVAVLTGRFRELHLAKLGGVSSEDPGEWTKEYATALREIDAMGYYMDLVAFGEEAEIRASAAAIDEVMRRLREGQL